MSEKLIKFGLSELKTVRITCAQEGTAGGSLEVPVDKITSALINGECPICHQRHLTSFSTALSDLGHAFTNLKALDSQATLDFILPAKD